MRALLRVIALSHGPTAAGFRNSGIALQGGQHRVLNRVLGVGTPTEQAHRDRVHGGPVSSEQRARPRRVTASGGGNQVRIIGHRFHDAGAGIELWRWCLHHVVEEICPVGGQRSIREATDAREIE
jgi:hypothetical protein